MLLIFCANATSRVHYVLKQVFTHSLGIEYGVTDVLDAFIAHAGPKMSYGKKPLGNEFFVQSSSLLFEQGIREQPVEVKTWQGHCCFFLTGQQSKIPFDIFAATFYLLSRYEEYLPHLKDEHGRFLPQQSLAAAHDFLEEPLVDFWLSAFYELLKEAFPDLSTSVEAKEKFMPLVEVISPFKYANKSVFRNVVQWFRSLYRLDFWSVLEQLLVLMGFRKDPWDVFEDYTRLFAQATFKTRFFFLFSKESFFDRGISTNNIYFKNSIKSVADYFPVALLGSYLTQQHSEDLLRERDALAQLIHRPVSSARFAWGVTTVGRAYRPLLAAEMEEDFSLCYPDTLGFRASTAVPFFYYDLGLEVETSLTLYPVAAPAQAMAKIPVNQLARQLERLHISPLPAAVHCIVLRNHMLEDSLANAPFRAALIAYLRSYD